MINVSRFFRQMSLGRKVVVIKLTVSTISLLLIGIGLLLHERAEFERQTTRKLTLLADVVGLNSTAALAFDDPAAADETLAVLASDEHVLAAALYEQHGNLFAHYRRGDITAPLPETMPAIGNPTFTDHEAAVLRPIRLKGKLIGHVYLGADTDEWQETLWAFGGSIAVLFLAVAAVSVFASIWLQRQVADPISHLAELMRRVGQEHDYTLRSYQRNDGEIGVLVDGFNNMLEEIGQNRTELERTRDELRQFNADLEQRVAERTAQLETANKELESFSYSVSHDLRAPLRAIDGFSRILLDEHSATLNADGRDSLERVRRGAQRMGLLIDDLLKLARVTRAEPTREPVDLSALAQDIVQTLQAQDPQRQVRFVLAPNLKVQGDPRLLRIALENLLGNAWKFTGTRPEAQVELGVQSNTPTVYFVRDNGAGFDMNYAGKLFTPFQRLHAAHEFPGTGIGLATVQRVMRKHGGRIWAEGTVDRGATFYFTLN